MEVASGLPLPCLPTATQFSRGIFLVLIRRSTGHVLVILLNGLAFMAFTLWKYKYPISDEADRALWLGRGKRSGDQLQGGVQGTLLDLRPLAEPSRVHTVLIAACTTLVIDKLGHGVKQTPGGAAC